MFKFIKFYRYLIPFWKKEALILLLTLITVFGGLINPYLAKLVIDKAYAYKDLILFFILAFIGAGIFVIDGIATALSSYLSKRITCYVNFDITSDLFKHMQGLPLNFYNDKSTGEHVYKISNDTALVSGFICNDIPQAIILIPRILFILAVVFYLNWKLAIFALCLAPFGYIQQYFFTNRLKKAAEAMANKSQNVFTRLHEVFSHIFLIKAFDREDYEIKKFKESLSMQIASELKRTKLSHISGFFNGVSGKAIGGVVALYGGYQVIKGAMTLGSLTAIMIYITQMIFQLKSLGNFYETAAVTSVAAERLNEIFGRENKIVEKKNAIKHNILAGRVDFKDVTFAYKDNNYILENLSFPIKPNSKIAIVGASGCGKSTLLSLILRLYDPQQGSIFIDGVDIKDVRPQSIKEQTAIVLQEPLLWNDSIRNNILYGKIDASEDEVINAAKIAQAHNFIIGLPQGYNTIMGEMACKISEGQKQRIAIARAVIKKPKILILDEAMSSLDSETEDKIIENILNEFSSSTIIAVSHLLSTVKKMNKVYFLEGPGNVMIGTHQELVINNPKYLELFKNQAENLELKVRSI